jgi:hypothetical protein
MSDFGGIDIPRQPRFNWADCPHHERPEPQPDRPFAYFQWNYGWGHWEQVIPEAAYEEGVVAAYAALAGATNSAMAELIAAASDVLRLRDLCLIAGVDADEDDAATERLRGAVAFASTKASQS